MGQFVDDQQLRMPGQRRIRIRLAIGALSALPRQGIETGHQRTWFHFHCAHAFRPARPPHLCAWP